MAKRFIDTELFEDEWFMALSKDAKITWIYFITKCNHAGILKLNKRLFEFSTGINSIDTVLKELGNRLHTVSDDVYFIPKFISFQYPDFPKSKVKQQESAIKILQEYNLFVNGNIQLGKSMVTVSKDLTKSYDNDNGSVIGSESVNEEIKLDDLKNKYLPNKNFGIELFKNESGEAQFFNEEIERTARRKLTYDDFVDFNSQLKINDKVHKNLREYVNHMRNWITTRPSKPKEEVDMYGNPRPSNQHCLLNGKWFVQ